MVKNTREELQNVSSQFLEIFIQDLFLKNKINTASVKESMSDDQKKRLKETVDNLKIQVEDFLDKPVTNTATEMNKEPTSSPLRESFRLKETAEEEIDNSNE